MFFNFHPEYNPDVKIAELIDSPSDTSTTSWRPYPDVGFQKQITTVLSMRIDSANNRLWLLDFGLHGMMDTPALIAISLESDTEVIKHTFPKAVAGMGSMLNDFAISIDGRIVYIADTSILAQSPAILVYSVEENLSYRLLSSLPSLYGQSSFFNIHQQEIGFGPFGMKINVDSIALSRDNRALYFAPLTGSDLLCVDVSLLHAAMCEPDGKDCLVHQEMLRQGVQVVLHDKPITDGITTDEDGNVWLTALGHSSIGSCHPLLIPPQYVVSLNMACRTAVNNLTSSPTCAVALLYRHVCIGLASPVPVTEPSAGGCGSASFSDNTDIDSEAIPDNDVGVGVRSSGICGPLTIHNVIENTDLLRWADGFSFGPGECGAAHTPYTILLA